MLLVQRAVLQYLVPHHKILSVFVDCPLIFFVKLRLIETDRTPQLEIFLKHLLSMAAMYTEIFLPFDKSGVA